MKKNNFRSQNAPVRSNQFDIPKHWRVVVGTHAINEALQTNPKAAEKIWFVQGWESHGDLKKIHSDFRSKLPEMEIKPAAFLDKLNSSHQGAALFMSSSPQLNWDELAHKPKSIVLLLDGIEDPHNLGAILRTAWLMKVDAILIPQDRAVGLTSTVHKVACGGVEHVPVEVCSNFSNPLEELKKMGYWVYGLSHHGKHTIYSLKLPEKVVWCIGAEDKGLRTTTEKFCDELVRIPQASAAASYNASVATAISLAETCRQVGQ